MLEVAQKYLQLKSGEYYKCFGKVDKVVGLTIESIGPKAKLNDLCMIFLDKERRDYVMSEVVGFKDSHIILMPFDNVEGVGVGCIVENTGHPLTVAVGDELLGHTVDGIGRVTDCDEKDLELDSEYPIEAPPPDPMSREIISDVLPLGVKAVDGLITVGKGQRIGIFAGSGVGKSTLLGMFARNTKADINVIALIGERGREVREFIERDLGPEGMARSVVVVATSDKPALIRNKAAKTATSIAEYFRDKGEDVLLMMDSLTRFSMAQREIGLASGEPPVTRGYPPSVYSEMPKLLERAGRADKGSITGLYTVLVDGDDFNEPITDTARSIIDEAIKNIELRTGKTANDADLAKELSISEDELCSWQSQLKVTNVVSLDEFDESGPEPVMDAAHNSHYAQPEEIVTQEELKTMLVKSLDNLTEKERRVIELYYYEDLTLKEISNILEVSESRVSQLHTKGLIKMRKVMGPYMNILTNV